MNASNFENIVVFLHSAWMQQKIVHFTFSNFAQNSNATLECSNSSFIFFEKIRKVKQFCHKNSTRNQFLSMYLFYDCLSLRRLYVAALTVSASPSSGWFINRQAVQAF
jgi:hypothetical protein